MITKVHQVFRIFHILSTLERTRNMPTTCNGYRMVSQTIYPELLLFVGCLRQFAEWLAKAILQTQHHALQEYEITNHIRMTFMAYNLQLQTNPVRPIRKKSSSGECLRTLYRSFVQIHQYNFISISNKRYLLADTSTTAFLSGEFIEATLRLTTSYNEGIDITQAFTRLNSMLQYKPIVYIFMNFRDLHLFFDSILLRAPLGCQWASRCIQWSIIRLQLS